jgi:hypothetical protein
MFPIPAVKMKTAKTISYHTYSMETYRIPKHALEYKINRAKR